MALWKGVYHQENHKIHHEFQHLFKGDHSWPWMEPIRVNLEVQVAFRVGWLVLQGGHTCIMQLQRFTPTNAQKVKSAYYLEKLKNLLCNFWVSNKIRY